MRGLIVAIEGLDGTGKSTLARGLAAALRGDLLTTPGDQLRVARVAVDAAWAQDPLAAQLFYAASVMAASGEATRRAAAGRDVVIDRYWISTVVNAALRGDALALPEVERALRPADLTIVVEVPETERHARLAGRGLSAHDRMTLRPELAAALLTGYRAGLRRPVAGRGVILDARGLSEAALVATVERLVTLERGRLRTRSGHESPCPSQP
jgi:dTMP kinase